MASRIRRFIESALYAGLKPNAPSRESQRGGWLVRLKAPLERLLSGKAPSDPLYLSNRTWKQKLKLGVAVGAPCVLLLGAMALALSNVYSPQAAPPPEPTAAEIVANLLPDLEKTLGLESNRDTEMLEVRVDKNGPASVTGSVKNKTDRALSVEFTLDLTDSSGSRLGSVSGRVENTPAGGVASFRVPIIHQEAALVIVRELKALN